MKASYVEIQFDNALPGDRVWHINYGWGTIKERYFGCGDLLVEFGDGTRKIFTYSGVLSKSRYSPDDIQELFWDEVKLVKPPTPDNVLKRKYIAPSVLFDGSKYYEFS